MTDVQQVRDLLKQVQTAAVAAAEAAAAASQPAPPPELPPAGDREAALLADMQRASGVKQLAPTPNVPDRQPATWDEASILADMQQGLRITAGKATR